MNCAKRRFIRMCFASALSLVAGGCRAAETQHYDPFAMNRCLSNGIPESWFIYDESRFVTGDKWESAQIEKLTAALPAEIASIVKRVGLVWWPTESQFDESLVNVQSKRPTDFLEEVARSLAVKLNLDRCGKDEQVVTGIYAMLGDYLYQTLSHNKFYLGAGKEPGENSELAIMAVSAYLNGYSNAPKVLLKYRYIEPNDRDQRTKKGSNKKGVRLNLEFAGIAAWIPGMGRPF